ncbi:MAG TPA: pyridoxal phosphate-dependent aminotransferase [Vicinamibacterales bacterium]|jgi:aspartate/methionine/tyrosine aminotransferase|nr:pyridoxal phosphate-dependent aminotransferase [Vicinamibacterales bacterium]
MPQVLKIQSRMDAVQAPIVPVVGDLIRQVPGTISLGQGVVHYGPPPAALDAVRAALADPSTHEYQDGSGLPPLIERLTIKLREENGIDVRRGSRIMVTAGSNMAFMHAVFAITEPGDEIILNVPFYFNHEMAIQMAGCTVVRVATDAHYQLRPDALRRAITERTRAIVTVSPNNPSGAVFRESALREVNALCAERGLYHISDEVYEYFTYGDAAHVSPGSFPDAADRTISMYSLSKAYGFAGWRVGYVVYPEHLLDAMMKSQDTILVCAPAASQIGAIAAIGVGRAYADPYVRELADVRDIVVSKLTALAPTVEVPTADGAFYCLLKVRTDMNPLALAERLIREHKVAVIPGPAFGMTDGCYFRVAYGALQKATVAEGIGRLVDGLRALV